MSTYKIDTAHSEVTFKVKHLMITNVTGQFAKFDATMESEAADFSDAKISFEADVDSISTNNEQRDGHLKSEDFFAAEKFPKLSFTALFSYTGETFADALNTIKPAADGSVGLVPSYTLFDLNGSFRLNKNLFFRAGVNNLFNNQYFTKRPTFYPGPGVWSSDGRSLTATVSIKI